MVKQATKKVAKKVKAKKIKLPIARIFLKANFNNSIITLTDMDGKVLSWSSSGKMGFKGSKKSTPFASQKATEDVLTVAKNYEVSTVHLQINGGGMGRDSFIRAVQAANLQIESIKDTTSFPFGGPTLRKRRRV